MTLNNKNAKRKFGLTETITSTGINSSYRKKDCGDAYVFDVEGYKVVKNVYFNGTINYVVSGKNIIDAITFSDLNMLEIEKINEKLRLSILSKIMESDLTRVKKVMNENKKGFIFFMEHLMNEGTSKDLAFGEVVRDYYSDSFDYYTDTNAIVKVMIKYGYKFTSMAEVNKLIRK